jgi:hypothetical protein
MLVRNEEEAKVYKAEGGRVIVESELEFSHFAALL